ncbi:hypothetical protein ACFSPU_07695 [Haoranjiania flava]|uniref:Lipoprotein n=1 Tax=Haoranjiania flava TaxID=1856322 RepID=A0AAE3LQI5_9BACT|nr:hypothetical protein [Haoranjiania flava]MCU7694530.1 hypothetical protein [Haoranjiania flava]
MKRVIIICVGIVMITFSSCRNREDAQAEKDTIDTDALLKDTMSAVNTDTLLKDSGQLTVNRENSIISFSNAVLETLEQKNFDKLASYVDPVLGVVFAPYSFIENSRQNHFTKDDVVKFGKSNTRRIWGYADGSGEPINLSFKEYIDEYVYDADFLMLTSVEANKSLFRKSNGVDNSLQKFPGKTFVDYYKKPKAGESEFDWKNLRLIFNEREGHYYLIAVVHNEWQI